MPTNDEQGLRNTATVSLGVQAEDQTPATATEIQTERHQDGVGGLLKRMIRAGKEATGSTARRSPSSGELLAASKWKSTDQTKEANGAKTSENIALLSNLMGKYMEKSLEVSLDELDCVTRMNNAALDSYEELTETANELCKTQTKLVEQAADLAPILTQVDDLYEAVLGLENVTAQLASYSLVLEEKAQLASGRKLVESENE